MDGTGMLWLLLGLFRGCTMQLNTAEEYGVRAMCLARCLQSDVDCDFVMETCFTNLASKLLETGQSLPNSSTSVEDKEGRVELVCRDEDSLEVEWQSTPWLIYVVERSKMEDQFKIWEPVNITTNGRIKIFDMIANSSYKIRVRGFADDGLVGTETVSDILSTSFDNEFLEPVSSLTFTEIPVFNKGIQAVIEWTPSSDMPCHYDVLIWAHEGLQAPIHVQAQELFKAELPLLEFESKYFVSVRAYTKLLDGTIVRESNQTTTDIITQDCFYYYPGNLSICSPEIPANVTTTEELNKENYLQCDFHTSWSTPNELPEYYMVNLNVFNNRHQMHKVEEKTITANISGNLTKAVLSLLLPLGELYATSVTAVSAGGQSISNTYYKRNRHCLPRENHSLAVLWTLLIMFLAIILILLGVMMCYCHKKKESKIIKVKSIYNQEEFKKSSSLYEKSFVEDEIIQETDEFEIRKDNLIICDLLGEGAFGIVHKGLLSFDAGPPQDVAIKMLQDKPTTEDLRQFQKEIEVMKSVGKHKNIVSLIGCCTQRSQLLLVIEYCALGDLQNYLRKEWKVICSLKDKEKEIQKNNDGIKYAHLLLLNSQGSCSEDIEIQRPRYASNKLYETQGSIKVERRLTTEDLLAFARQIAIGMEYLSNNKVIHRDLAARNVLVCSDLTLKISDFGLSKDVYEQNIYRKKESERLPIKWMALESLMHQVYTTQSDIWSFGILLWEIVTLGCNPYPSTQTSQMLRLLKFGYRMERPPSCCITLYNIMLSCWRANPKSRPSFSMLVKQLDKLLESHSVNEYLNLDLLSYKEYGEIWEITSSSDESVS